MNRGSFGVLSVSLVIGLLIMASVPTTAATVYSGECEVEVVYVDDGNWESTMFYGGEKYGRPMVIDRFWNDGDDVYFNVTLRFYNEHSNNSYSIEWEVLLLEDELYHIMWGGDVSPVYNQSAVWTMDDIGAGCWTERQIVVGVYDVPDTQELTICNLLYVYLDEEFDARTAGCWLFNA